MDQACEDSESEDESSQGLSPAPGATEGRGVTVYCHTRTRPLMAASVSEAAAVDHHLPPDSPSPPPTDRNHYASCRLYDSSDTSETWSCAAGDLFTCTHSVLPTR